MRDLSQDQIWQQSLERSRARREQRDARQRDARQRDARQRDAPQRAAREQPQPVRKQAVRERPRPAPQRTVRERPRPVRQRTGRRRRLPTAMSAVVALSAVALALGTVIPLLGHGIARRTAQRVDVVSASSGTAYADSGHTAFGGGDGLGIGHGRAGSCHPVSTATGYMNPLAHARVKPERIDQGVDYAGTGTLAAIGPGKVTEVGTDGTGWPGAFIEYQLMTGPSAGCYVFYAEGVEPVSGLHKGQTVLGGQEIASIIEGWSTGIEIGWGAGVGTKTYAAQTSGWTTDDDAHSVASPAGLTFSALITALGGPAGKVEGRR